MHHSRRDTFSQVLRTFVYVVVLAFFLFPIFWIIATAFKTGEEFLHTPPIWIPRNPTLHSFEHVVEVGGLDALKNTLIISLSATAAVAHHRLAGRLWSGALSGGRRQPAVLHPVPAFHAAVAVIFPFLLIFKTLKWMDTYQALILLHLTFNLPYAVWMMRSFFVEMPREIEESALVDGCSPFGAFWRVAMPLVTPGLIATGVFCFIFSWSEFFFALSLTHTKAVPLSVFLPNFFGKHDGPMGRGRRRVGHGDAAALRPELSSCSATWCAASPWAPSNRSSARALNRRTHMKKGLIICTPDVAYGPLALLSGTFEQKAARAAALGFDGVELMVRDPSLLDWPAIKDPLEQHGLGIAQIVTGELFGVDGLGLITSDQALHRRAVERAKAIIDLAAFLGTMVNVGRFRGRLDWLSPAERTQKSRRKSCARSSAMPRRRTSGSSSSRSIATKSIFSSRSPTGCA